MYIVLSQRVDIASNYQDELFKTYHFPSRYKNSVRSGDIFVYYQGNRYVKAQRYYYGMGKIGEICTDDQINYYASIIDGRRFINTVPIYTEDGSYYESIGYKSIRNSVNPPWQSSIRPISEDSFRTIVTTANGLNRIREAKSISSTQKLKDDLKIAIKKFYLEENNDAIFDVIETASLIASNFDHIIQQEVTNSEVYTTIPVDFVKYCNTLQMSYSYKPVLIKAMLENNNWMGDLEIDNLVEYFLNFYEHRRKHNLRVEKANSIYYSGNISSTRAKNNIINNPISALERMNIIYFDRSKNTVRFCEEIQNQISDVVASTIVCICENKLDEYYARLK